MAVKKELVIVIAEDGTIQMTTHGIKGAECEEEVKSFEKVLGKASHRVRTSEFYERAKATTKVSTKRK